MPAWEQPYATIVTKNYPDDEQSELDRPDRWRLNTHVGTNAFVELTGENPRSHAGAWDYAATTWSFPTR